MGTTVARRSYMSLVANRLRHLGSAVLTTVNNASMCGMGTVLGTARRITLDEHRGRLAGGPIARRY